MELLHDKKEKLHAAYHHHHFNNISFTFHSDVRSPIDRIVQNQLQVDSTIRYNFASIDYIALCAFILDYSDYSFSCAYSDENFRYKTNKNSFV
ncbi:unnamed protein product [Adineta ricciae]|uniref:Uncharacterized protein n=1 Tax=Adineta ricciae TaxID=249248 RepID=A0A815AI04_ADIRI|nr:unnamed protein product [Adineta ricciae]